MQGQGRNRSDGQRCEKLLESVRRSIRNSQSMAVTQLHMDTGKTEALWLVTSKPRASAFDFDAKVVSPKELGPLAETLEAKTRDKGGKLTERSLPDDD